MVELPLLHNIIYFKCQPIAPSVCRHPLAIVCGSTLISSRCPYRRRYRWSNNNWFMAFVSNTGASQNYNFTTPITQGFHSIQVFMQNGAHNGTGAVNNNTQYERLNIIGTGTALPSEPLPQTRDPSKFPLSSFHFFNTPFGTGASFLALNNPVAQTLNGTGGNGASITANAASFSCNVWTGQSTDPVWTLTSSDNVQNPTSPISTPIPVRCPSGMYSSLDTSDMNNCMIDGTNPRYAYPEDELFLPGARAAPTGSPAFIMDNYNLNHAPPQSMADYPGLIRVADLDSGVIAHRLGGGMGFAASPGPGAISGYGAAVQTTQWAGITVARLSIRSPTGTLSNEYTSVGYGIRHGAVAGIFPGTATPGGLNAATLMAWNCCTGLTGSSSTFTSGTYSSRFSCLWGRMTAEADPCTGMQLAPESPIRSASINYDRPPRRKYHERDIASGRFRRCLDRGLGGGSPVVALLPGLIQGCPISSVDNLTYVSIKSGWYSHWHCTVR